MHFLCWLQGKWFVSCYTFWTQPGWKLSCDQNFRVNTICMTSLNNDNRERDFSFHAHLHCRGDFLQGFWKATGILSVWFAHNSIPMILRGRVSVLQGVDFSHYCMAHHYLSAILAHARANHLIIDFDWKCPGTLSAEHSWCMYFAHCSAPLLVAMCCIGSWMRNSFIGYTLKLAHCAVSILALLHTVSTCGWIFVLGSGG